MKTLIDVAAGVAGGFLGTLVMNKVLLKAGAKLPQQFQPKIHKSPPGFILDKVENVMGRELPDQLREKLEPVLQHVYGWTGPIVLGALAQRIGHGSIGRIIAAGAIMGVIVWGIGYLGWMPVGGVAEPVHRQPIGATANAVVGHAIYGVVAATPIALADHYA